MKPIKPSLLCDTATVEPEDTSTDFGSHYLEPVSYRRVRLDTESTAIDTPWSDDDTPAATLFVDAVLSVPATPPPLRARVTVPRATGPYVGFVRAVDELMGRNGQIHHWEVRLA